MSSKINQTIQGFAFAAVRLRCQNKGLPQFLSETASRVWRWACWYGKKELIGSASLLKCPHGNIFLNLFRLISTGAFACNINFPLWTLLTTVLHSSSATKYCATPTGC